MGISTIIRVNQDPNGKTAEEIEKSAQYNEASKKMGSISVRA
jgi:hypothetical protein